MLKIWEKQKNIEKEYIISKPVKYIKGNKENLMSPIEYKNRTKERIQ